MTLVSSGALSIGDINVELGRTRTSANSSLQALANLAKAASTPYVNRAAPKISHWYGYQNAVYYINNLMRNVASGASATCSTSSGNLFTLYSSTTTLSINDVVYTNTALNTVFNGGGFAYLLYLDNSGLVTINNSGIVTNIETCSIADTAAPNNVTGVSISNVGTTTLDLTWTCSTDNVGIAGYKIYINGSATAAYTIPTNQSSGNFTYGITGLSASTSYYFTVKAYDAAGNHSSGTNSASINTDSDISNVYSFPISDSTAPDVNFACMINLTSICYSSIEFIGIGSYIYTNQALTIPYNTLGNYSHILVEGYQYAIKTLSNGNITEMVDCDFTPQ